MPPSPPASSASSSFFDHLCQDDTGELTVSVDSEPEAGSTRFPADSVDPSSRRAAVEWILKVRAHYRFSPLTAYLAVIYMNRFLSFHLLQRNGWALQLLSVACLSLAVKMEEELVPTLLDLQVEGAKFIFEPRTVLRMELLVLSALDWRLRAVTPFAFINFFALKVEPSSKRAKTLGSKATQIILSSMHEIDIASHSPSALAAAAIICAVEEMQDLAIVGPSIAASWIAGLTEESISNCYRTMQRIVVERRLRNSPVILSQHRVTSPAKRGSGTSSSSSSSLPNKRRKCSNHSCN